MNPSNLFGDIVGLCFQFFVWPCWVYLRRKGGRFDETRPLLAAGWERLPRICMHLDRSFSYN